MCEKKNLFKETVTVPNVPLLSCLERTKTSINCFVHKADV